MTENLLREMVCPATYFTVEINRHHPVLYLINPISRLDALCNKSIFQMVKIIAAYVTVAGNSLRANKTGQGRC